MGKSSQGDILISVLIFLFFLLQLQLIGKVYAALATPVPDGNAAGNRSKLGNYFLHQPYGPNTYAFGYELDDGATGNVQFRDERRYLNGSIEGSYGYVRPDGLIQVTRYRAGQDEGYLAHSQSYAPGDERVETVWPTQRPDLFKNQNAAPPPAVNVSWDPMSHLNVSVDQVEQDVVEQLKQQHGLDLSHIDVQQDVLQPAVLDIVNGKTPLKAQPNGSLAFETLNNIIDKDLPLVPFQLPPEQLHLTTPEPLGDAAEQSKYNKAKANNDEKAPQAEAAAGGSLPLPPPQPLTNDPSDGSSWYQRIIEANRREFLEPLPKLNRANA